MMICYRSWSAFIRCQWLEWYISSWYLNEKNHIIIMCSANNELFFVDNKPEIGRFVRAKRRIEAGGIFIDEVPFVIGPKPCTPPICLGCYIPIDGSGDGPRCSRCRWPLCAKCDSIVDETHHAAECVVFIEHKVKFQNFPSTTDACMQLDCITPLRMLLRKKADPERWTTQIESMEYHPQERQNSPTYRADAVNVVNYLRGPCKLRDHFSEETIQQVCGILEVNSFEARTPNDHRVRCIYPTASIMAHSCTPNTTHSILPSDNFRWVSHQLRLSVNRPNLMCAFVLFFFWSIQLRAAVDIEEGQPLYVTYSYTLGSTQRRQTHIRLSKYFQCQCERCSDPTELGTELSSFICQACSRGLIRPVSPKGMTL